MYHTRGAQYEAIRYRNCQMAQLLTTLSINAQNYRHYNTIFVTRPHPNWRHFCIRPSRPLLVFSVSSLSPCARSPPDPRGSFLSFPWKLDYFPIPLLQFILIVIPSFVTCVLTRFSAYKPDRACFLHPPRQVLISLLSFLVPEFSCLATGPQVNRHLLCIGFLPFKSAQQWHPPLLIHPSWPSTPRSPSTYLRYRHTPCPCGNRYFRPFPITSSR